jgi:hypothetical protein
VNNDNLQYVNNTTKANLLKNLGIEYIIENNNDYGNRPPPIAGYSRLYPDEKGELAYFFVFKSNNPAPQIYFASSIQKMNPAGQLSAIKFNTLGYHEMAADIPSRAPDNAFSGTASYNLDINKITINTTANQGQYVFIGQTYRPQWRAYIDNKPVKILPADYNFMTIYVQPGKHHITLLYKPLSFVYGIIISSMTLLLMLIGIGYTIFFGRHSRKTKKGRRARSPHSQSV